MLISLIISFSSLRLSPIALRVRAPRERRGNQLTPSIETTKQVLTSFFLKEASAVTIHVVGTVGSTRGHVSLGFVAVSSLAQAVVDLVQQRAEFASPR